MQLYCCLCCGKPFGICEFVTKPAKEQYRWSECTQYRSFCPHCEAEVALEAKFQRWALLALPAIVLFVWDVALSKQGGIDSFLLHGSFLLAAFGMAMLFLTRRLVVINLPSNNRSKATRIRCGVDAKTFVS